MNPSTERSVMRAILWASFSVNLMFAGFYVSYFIVEHWRSPVYTSLFAKVWRPDLNNDVPSPLPRCVVLPKNAVTGPNFLMMLGDSFTAFTDWKRLLKRSDVVASGISGQNSDCLLYRLPALLRYPSKKLFLLIGLNDLRDGKEPKLVAANYERIVSSIRLSAPETRLYLQSLFPVVDGVLPAITADEIVELNGWIARIAKTHKATYIDLHSKFSEGKQIARLLTSDGYHLSLEGYLA